MLDSPTKQIKNLFFGHTTSFFLFFHATFSRILHLINEFTLSNKNGFIARKWMLEVVPILGLVVNSEKAVSRQDSFF